MQFDKPKVTIDLEEYQHLKDRVAGMDSDDMLLAAKEAIAILATNNNSLGKALLYLKEEKGILITFTVKERNWTFGERIMAEDVQISKINPKK